MVDWPWKKKPAAPAQKFGPPDPKSLPEVLSRFGPGTLVAIHGNPVADYRHRAIDAGSIVVPYGSQGQVKSVGDETVMLEIIDVPGDDDDEGLLGTLWHFKHSDVWHPLTPDAQKRWASDEVKKALVWNGLPINIEWEAGEIRSYEDSDYSRYMVWSYGYLRNTDSTDGEEIDCFVGEREDVDNVYVCVQKAGDYEVSEGAEKGSFDEFDLVLGAADTAEAEAVMRLHYDDDQVGAIFEIPLAAFKEIVLPQL